METKWVCLLSLLLVNIVLEVLTSALQNGGGGGGEKSTQIGKKKSKILLFEDGMIV